MNWNKFIVFGLIISMLAVGGCSAETSENAVKDVTTKNNEVTEGLNTDRESDSIEVNESKNEESAVKAVSEEDMKMAENAMIIGKIVSIYGNYIQVDKVDLPEKMLERMGGADGNKSGGGSESEQTSIASTVSGAGMPPGGGRQPGAGQGAGRGTTDMEFSGEILDIMIPVGSSINSQSDNTLELTYESLNKGMLVRIKVDLDMTKEFQESAEVETFYADNVLVLE